MSSNYVRAHYMSIIHNKAKRDKEAAMTEEEKRQAEWEKAYNEVSKLSDRIADILAIANECKRNGIKIPERSTYDHEYATAKKYGYDAEFICEGIRHHVGLHDRSRGDKYDCLAILNGGICGNINLKVTDEDIWGVYEDGDMRGQRTQARLQDMLQFVREFPVFEEAFYKWLNSLEEG